MILMNILPPDFPLGWVIFASLAGSFVGGFLSQLGKHLATRKALRKITEEMESIKATVGDESYFLREDRGYEREAIHMTLDVFLRGARLEQDIWEAGSILECDFYDDRLKESRDLWEKCLDDFRSIYTKHFIYLRGEIAVIALEIDKEIERFQSDQSYGGSPEYQDGAAIFTRERKEELEKAIRHRLDHFAEKP